MGPYNRVTLDLPPRSRLGVDEITASIGEKRDGYIGPPERPVTNTQLESTTWETE